jgi:protein-tyrosine phosphatase
MAPEASGKLMMLTRWRGGHDIPDPYRQPREVFERTCDMIQNAIEGWLPYLQGGATAMEPTES